MDYRPKGIVTFAVALGLLPINPIPHVDLNGSAFIAPGGLAEAKAYKSIDLPECQAEIFGEVILSPTSRPLVITNIPEPATAQRLL